MKKMYILIISLIIPQVVGLTSAFFTSAGTKEWYPALTKPALTPPGWIFGPVWTLLYITMGIALFLVWKKGISAEGVKLALVAFGIQMALNFFWSVLFFGLRMPAVAFIEIIILWIAIIITTVLFYRQSVLAGLLLVPYLLWVSFASYLNLYFWLLNR